MNGDVTQTPAERQVEMARLVAEIATERKEAKRLQRIGAHRFAQFHWGVVDRDRVRLRKLIDAARQETQA